MRKLNNVGFTLIELLAVITIMGILLMVAVPSVSRTIENSRRDTFADNALKYIDTVRTAVLADEVSCDHDDDSSTKALTASGTPDGDYYFVIDTTQPQTQDIMEKVARSSWGGNEIKGYVKWSRATNGAGRTVTSYSVFLADTAEHGFKEEINEVDVSRSKIFTAGATDIGVPDDAHLCTLK